jgi:hypothetical protein
VAVRPVARLEVDKGCHSQAADLAAQKARVSNSVACLAEVGDAVGSGLRMAVVARILVLVVVLEEGSLEEVVPAVALRMAVAGAVEAGTSSEWFAVGARDTVDTAAVPSWSPPVNARSPDVL